MPYEKLLPKVLYPGHGTTWKIGYEYLLHSRPTFRALVAFHEPVSACFGFQDPCKTFAPNHEFLELISSEASKLGKAFIPKNQIKPKISSQGYICS